MPRTRRAVLGSLAGLAGLTALAGCSGGGPSEPTETLTPADVPTRVTSSRPGGSGARLAFERIDPREVPAGAPIAVLAPEWREWLRRAADGETVRATARPEAGPHRPAMDRLEGVALRTETGAAAYELSLESGPAIAFALVAERVDAPPDGTTAHPLEALPGGVREPFLEAIERGRVELTPEMHAAQFHAEHGRPGEGAHRVLYVAHEGEVYRLGKRVPTVTPPEAFYVILRLSSTAELPAPPATLDLRVDEAAAAPLREGVRASENGERRPLSAYPAAARALAVEASYAATLTAFYRLRIED